MTTETAPKTAKRRPEFDPDSYRMTIGEHLEELRTRLILGLGGFLAAAIVCMCMKETVMRFFLRPLMIGLARNHLPPQINFAEVSESFMVYIRVSMIVGAAFASPWLLYQLWQFVAAGLYPRERKYITKYLPLSIILLITGMLFLYYIVLPLMIEFFLAFNFGPAFVFGKSGIDQSPAATQPVVVPYLEGDPPTTVDGQIWFDRGQDRLKIKLDGKIRIISFGLDTIGNPIIMLGTYIDMVVAMLLSFGLAFQMPLVVLALVRIGIVDVPTLKKMRRVVYFCMSIVAAVIVPDVVTGMLALLVPLILLFEMGLWLARTKPREQGER